MLSKTFTALGLIKNKIALLRYLVLNYITGMALILSVMSAVVCFVWFTAQIFFYHKMYNLNHILQCHFLQ